MKEFKATDCDGAELAVGDRLVTTPHPDEPREVIEIIDSNRTRVRYMTGHVNVINPERLGLRRLPPEPKAERASCKVCRAQVGLEAITVLQDGKAVGPFCPACAIRRSELESEIRQKAAEHGIAIGERCEACGEPGAEIREGAGGLVPDPTLCSACYERCPAGTVLDSVRANRAAKAQPDERGISLEQLSKLVVVELREEIVRPECFVVPICGDQYEARVMLRVTGFWSFHVSGRYLKASNPSEMRALIRARYQKWSLGVTDEPALCSFPSCDSEAAEEFADHNAPGGKLRCCVDHAAKVREMARYPVEQPFFAMIPKDAAENGPKESAFARACRLMSEGIARDMHSYSMEMSRTTWGEGKKPMTKRKGVVALTPEQAAHLLGEGEERNAMILERLEGQLASGGHDTEGTRAEAARWVDWASRCGVAMAYGLRALDCGAYASSDGPRVVEQWHEPRSLGQRVGLEEFEAAFTGRR